MALDEACLVCAPAQGVYLRFYRWAGPAVTFGYSQAFALAEAAAQGRGLAGADVVRRSTGGGVVFHDGDITFSLCFPWPRICSPERIYERIHAAVLEGLRQEGVEAALWRPPAAAGRPRQAQCFTGPEPSDLVDGRGRKILGGALRRRGARGLYQGSLRLEGWTRRAELETNVTEALSRQWGEGMIREIETEWLRQAECLADKYRSDAWNKRR
ncbi:MAG TPA: hypothetical protein DEB40_06860 [Elusimicrobia bacterium]|nr:hypothetical protein [Elusimicrobiota bacterium]HBT61448.1 hypothetical protein [Elusimicrobiota bacterium]